MKVLNTNATHRAFWDQLTDIIFNHADDLSAQEMIALLSQMTGQLVARSNTASGGMSDAIAENIKAGYENARTQLTNECPQETIQ